MKMTEEIFQQNDVRSRAGEYLAGLRVKAQLTTAEAAEQLLLIEAAELAAMEAGERPMPAALWSRAARLYGADLEVLSANLKAAWIPLPFDAYWSKAA